MSKVTLKQKEYFIGKFRDFLSSSVGIYFTNINGEKIDTQKEFNKWLEKELTDLKYLEGFEWMKFADEVTPEYIDALHQQIIEKNKEASKNIETKQNKVVLAIFDLSDMD